LSSFGVGVMAETADAAVTTLVAAASHAGT
jgi:hypothetical protein